MAKKPKETAQDFADAFGKDIKFKSYKKDGSGTFDELEEGQEIDGVLVAIRDQTIIDTRTKKEKEIRVYSIRTEAGVLRISGRTLLDRAVDEIMDENGGYDVVNRRYSGIGYEWLVDRAVKFIRGKDAKTKGEGNIIGTYEVLVEED